METDRASAKRAVLYARVSTKDQQTGTQLDALRRLATQRGWGVVAEFVDEGVSGAKDTRPALDRLMRLVRTGGADVVAVWKFDRFARSLRHLVLAVEEFRTRGVAFVSMTEGIDPDTATGRLMLQIVGAFAEFERELGRERTTAALGRVRSRGTRLGRPRRVFDVEAARRLQTEGRSLRDIAQRLHVPRATLARALGRLKNGAPSDGT